MDAILTDRHRRTSLYSVFEQTPTPYYCVGKERLLGAAVLQLGQVFKDVCGDVSLDILDHKT
jgi:hypothetical protein